MHLKECCCKFNGCDIIIIHLVCDDFSHLGKILLIADFHNLRENLLSLHCRDICRRRYCARLNLSMAHILNFSYLVYLSADNECEGTSCPSCPSCTPYSMDIIFYILRYVVVKYSFNIINIYSSRCNIRRNKNLNRTISESVHNLISLEL